MLLATSNIGIFIIGSLIILLLLSSFFIIIVSNLTQKIKYQQGILLLREEQQNQLIESAVLSEEVERHRIAEILHDEIGAILSAAKLHFSNIKTTSLPTLDAQLHSTSKELLDEAIQKVRLISHNLHSNILKEFGLNEAIRHLVKTTGGTIITTELNLDDSYTAKDAAADISTYRMIQELLHNIIIHARPTELFINSRFTNNELSILGEHNGNGLTQEMFEALRFKTDGLGLRTIENRLILLKGTIAFAKSEKGYSILLTIPKTNSI
jgi:signal transduction histidine kinase